MVFSPLWRGGGSEVDLVMVTYTQSWFPGVPRVELFDGDAGIFEIFCGVPGLVVFWRITGLLGTVLEFVSVKARVNDFFEFVFWFSVYLNRRRRSLDL